MEVQLVTIPQAGAALGLSRSSVYVLLGQGALEAVSIGRARRITASSVRQLVASRLEAARRERGAA